MADLRFRDIVFATKIRDPFSDAERDMSVIRVVQSKDKPFTVTQDGPFLRITGRRTVITPIANVVDALPFESDKPEAAKGGGK